MAAVTICSNFGAQENKVCHHFLEEIFIVFPVLLFSSPFLLYSLRKAFISLLAIRWNCAFKWVYLSFSPSPFTSCLFSALCVRPPQTTTLPFLHFFFLGMVLITASYTMFRTSFHSFPGTLSDLIPSIYLSLPLYDHKWFDLGHAWMSWWFSLLKIWVWILP